MPDVQSAVSLAGWVPLVGLLFAAGCFTAGLGNAYRALWLWRHRNDPISDPKLAKFLEGIQPPPYATYAALWLAGGVVLAVLTALVWR